MERSEMYLQKKIIVIGAGMAGLACASHLKDYGFEKVLILEARNRIGGRTYTVTFDDEESSEESVSKFIEIGGQWIHGEDGNVIYELAHSKGLIKETDNNYIQALMEFNSIYSKEESEKIISLTDYLDEKIDGIHKDLKEDISVLEYLDEIFTEYLSKHDDPSSIELLKGAYKWYQNIHCELNGCKDLSDLSARLLDQYKECEGLQTVELKFGYSSILNLFLEKIPNDMILLNHVVDKIDWTDFKNDQSQNESQSSDHICNGSIGLKIKVYCDNGEYFVADHVIITTPLGFLKKNVNSLFLPSLSEQKLKAIDSIGFGAINKIYFEFTVPFWDVPTMYHVLWNKSLDEILQSSDESSKSWIKCISRFAYTPGHRNMLCAWVVGDGAVIMENLSLEDITANCMELLEKMIGKKLPSPARTIRSTWNSDPYACGSYSYLSMKCDKNSTSHMADPEFSNVFCHKHPVLQFAGEATHPFHFSTVHGAYETGLREAQRLFDHYRNCALRFNSDEKLNRISPENLFHQNMKILVIGAGIAGLAVALSLFRKGFQQISIVEAQDKIGGRISSIPFNNSILELGAQWIHGNNNPLYDFSAANNLLCDPLDEPSCEGKGLFCTANGDVIDISLVNEVKDMFEETKNDLCDGKYNFSSRSVQSFFLESFRSYCNNCSDKFLNSIKKGIFNWLLKFEIIDNSCDYLDEVAVPCYSEWCDVAENDYHINFRNGLSSVINAIYFQLPAHCLHLKKPAKAISWQRKFVYPQFNESGWRTRSSDNYPVLVECEDEVIPADAVVLTPSVGFIKENMDEFFKPCLPKSKAKAYSSIGFGTINKIYLIYENQFWKPEDQGFQLIWTKNLDEECNTLLKQHPWINGITGFDIIRKQPNVLLGWIGGVEAKMIESIDENTISIACTKLLKKFLRSPNIPNPVKTIRTCWYSNKYIRGAYSFRSIKFYESGSSLEDLQCPLYTSYRSKSRKIIQWPIVHFAGEVTEESSFSTVHGAFESGLKAANEIELSCNLIQEAISTDEDGL